MQALNVLHRFDFFMAGLREFCLFAFTVCKDRQ
jgi:hypothetical protein